jgi:hypothetical protein
MYDRRTHLQNSKPKRIGKTNKQAIKQQRLQGRTQDYSKKYHGTEWLRKNKAIKEINDLHTGYS